MNPAVLWALAMSLRTLERRLSLLMVIMELAGGEGRADAYI